MLVRGGELDSFKYLSLKTLAAVLSRIPKWLEGPSGGLLVQPLLSRDTQSDVAQDHIQVTFKDLQSWRLHSLSGQPVPVLRHLHSKDAVMM